jgi:hypothetical protein
MSVVEVKVPDIGDFDEVVVIELLVKAGYTVAAEQSLITVESDKASVEIPSSTAGIVYLVRKGSPRASLTSERPRYVIQRRCNALSVRLTRSVKE